MDLRTRILDPDEININTRNRLGQTPLIRACKLNLEEKVRDLLHHPFLDVNMSDGEGNTALMIACSRGYEAIVSLLLSHKDIQVNKSNGKEFPLDMACCNRHHGVVKLLLASEDIIVYTDTILTIMVLYDIYDTEILKSLLDHKDTDINLALTLACDIGFKMKKFILMLLQREDIKTTTRNIEAITNFVMKEYINQYSYNTDERVTNWEPFHSKLNMMKKMLNAKNDQRKNIHSNLPGLNPDEININCRDIFGQTPLIIACKLKLEEVVRFLLRHPSVDVNIADDEGDTALHIACGKGHEAIVSLLLSHKDIQVNKGNGKETPLMEACFYRHHGVVKLLLAREDVNVNAQDADENTALMIMIIGNKYDKEILRSLLDHKDMNINLTIGSAKYGYENALTNACDMGRKEFILMLLQGEDIQTTATNIKAITNFVMEGHTRVKAWSIDIKDARDMKVVIEEAVSKNLPDIARWLAKTEGYFFRACTATAALQRTNKGVKRVKN